MKLKDIISRTSLRNRAVGNLELPEQHVFEVTDLLVPAGTKWVDTDDSLHEIGRTSVPGWQWWVNEFTWIEISDPLPAGHNIQLQVFLDGAFISSASMGVSSGHRWASSASSGDGPNGSAPNDASPPLSAAEMKVCLLAAGPGDAPTTQPIHIVRARLVVLVT